MFARLLRPLVALSLCLPAAVVALPVQSVSMEHEVQGQRAYAPHSPHLAVEREWLRRLMMPEEHYYQGRAVYLTGHQQSVKCCHHAWVS